MRSHEEVRRVPSPKSVLCRLFRSGGTKRDSEKAPRRLSATANVDCKIRNASNFKLSVLIATWG